MKSTSYLLLAVIITSLFATRLSGQNPVNWTNDQLMPPAELAALIKEKKTVPIVFSVGPGATIPHSTAIGMVRDEANLGKFKKELEGLPKDAKIVVYCGCCPYEHCPNVRPAMQALKDMKFTNYMLLDLPHNIKIDWIDKGYPSE
jgi:thiosulfate/3-mercaptopyruvate sulfurtransferase